MIGRRSTRTGVLAAACLAVMFGGAVSHADVTLPALIGDNMVLQRDTQVALWGWARPGERVRVQPEWSEAGVETRWRRTIFPARSIAAASIFVPPISTPIRIAASKPA